MLAKPVAACTHLSILNSFPVIWTTSAKNCHFHVSQPTFLFPMETPLRLSRLSRNMLHGWIRASTAWQTCRSMYLSIFNSFWVIRCLSQCVKSKNRYFYHILVSPGDAPGAITLNVICMAREFDAYRLSRCMCPSNYNRFWDRVKYWTKIVIFSYPPCIRRPRQEGSRRNSAIPFGTEKLEWLDYPMVEKFWRYLYSFWCNSRMWQTDGRTDTACRQ